MKHTHTYEPLMHRRTSSELMKLGIEAAEIRKCRDCGQETPFVLTRKGAWVQLFDESEPDEQDILLA